MTPEKLKHSARRFNSRAASMHRRMVAKLLDRAKRSEGAHPVYRRGVIRGFTLETELLRRQTRQELRHFADWQQSRDEIGLA